MLGDDDLTLYNQAQMANIRGREIGYVPQDPMSNLNPVWSIGFQVKEAVRANGIASGKKEIEARAQAMDADIATATFKPDATGTATLAAAKRNAIQYELKGTLSVGKGEKGGAQSFKLDGKGYISPVPGVSNIWR